jgi:hypothetical protein
MGQILDSRHQFRHRQGNAAKCLWLPAMSIIVAELYDALRAAGVEQDKARMTATVEFHE